MPKGPRSGRPPPKNSGPSRYKPEYDDRAREYSFLSAKTIDLAVLFGVSDSTVENWSRDHPSFREALREGQDLANLRVVKGLYLRAVGSKVVTTREESTTGPNGPGTKSVRVEADLPPDVTAAISWLRHRVGWIDDTPIGPIRVIVEGGLPEPKDPPPAPPGTPVAE